MSYDPLVLDDFAEQFQKAPIAADNLPAVGSITLDEMEKAMIEKALLFHHQNMSKAARALGLSRGTLYRRMEKHNIPVRQK